jgi:hypothetical protein
MEVRKPRGLEGRNLNRKGATEDGSQKNRRGGEVDAHEVRTKGEAVK